MRVNIPIQSDMRASVFVDKIRAVVNRAAICSTHPLNKTAPYAEYVVEISLLLWGLFRDSYRMAKVFLCQSGVEA